jgi:alpha-L-rhamnosidase
MLDLMQHFAELLNKPEDKKEFNELAAHVKEAFNRKYLHPDSNFYANNTATANIFALA